MNSVCTLKDLRNLPDRRASKTRRVNGMRRNQVESESTGGVRFPGKYRLSFSVLSSLVVVFIGVAVLSTTGVLGGMTTLIGKMILGAIVVYTYLMAFRRGLSVRD